MIGISDSQAKILEKLIEYDLESSEWGLTSGAIEKRDINRKTFANNINWLLENYFVKITWSDDHGLQVWKYYMVTQLGVLAYLKWITKKDVEKSIDITERFAPLLVKHLGKIKEWYGDIADYALKKAVSQINVNPISVLHLKSKKKSQPSKEMVESMTLTFGSVDIIFYRDMGKPVFEKIHKFGKDIYDHRKNKKFGTDIANRFTFAYFFNLINLVYSTGDFMEASMEINPIARRFKNKIILEDTTKIIKRTESLVNKLQENKKKVIQMISEDKDLSELFKSTISEMSSKIKEPKIIKYLQESF